jgi:hypothetical protein
MVVGKMIIQELNNSQNLVTIPRDNGNAMDLAGEYVEWSIKSRNRIAMEVSSEGKIRIQKKSTGQFVVTVPKQIATSMDLAGAEVEWNLKSSDRLDLKVIERDSEYSEGGDNA